MIVLHKLSWIRKEKKKEIITKKCYNVRNRSNSFHTFAMVTYDQVVVSAYKLLALNTDEPTL